MCDSLKISTSNFAIGFGFVVCIQFVGDEVAHVICSRISLTRYIKNLFSLNEVGQLTHRHYAGYTRYIKNLFSLNEVGQLTHRHYAGYYKPCVAIHVNAHISRLACSSVERIFMQITTIKSLNFH